MTRLLDTIEKALDAFFAAPVKAWARLEENFFKYTYRETESGVFALFNTPEAIQKAARATRDKGYTHFDCLTPFPIHGLEFDMGLTRSKVPYATFLAGITGTTIAFLLMFTVHEQVSTIPYLNSYPLNISGKPTFAWPAMIPIMFELTVLLGGLTTVAVMYTLGRIPKVSRKVLHPRITDDRFCLWIPADSANYNETEVQAFLSGLGGSEITVVKANS